MTCVEHQRFIHSPYPGGTSGQESMPPLAGLPPGWGSCDGDLCAKATLEAMALSANIPSLFLSDPDQGLQTATDGTQRDASHLPTKRPQGSSSLGGSGSQTWEGIRLRAAGDAGWGPHSRCATEGPKGESLFPVCGVDVVAAQNVLAEVLMHHAGVIADPQLPQPRSPQQQVLIVDEGVRAAAKALVVVPLGPIQAVQQWALGKLDCELG